MLEKWLAHYINDPKNQEINFNLGWHYEQQGQTASAAGFYLRSIEFGKDVNKQYEALLRMALCFERQTNRVFTLKGVLLRAISILPKRPEAYFLLSRIYERNKDWQEGYTWAVMAQQFATDPDSTQTNVEYPGFLGFRFQQAVCAWWIGLWDESLALFRELKNKNLPHEYKISIENNLARLGSNHKEPMIYNNSKFEILRFKFTGSETIERNYSQCYQDMFVLTLLDGKTNGTYLEIGSADPYYGNNTTLLEQLGWNGISLDIDANSVNTFAQHRKNTVVEVDATKVDYDILLQSLQTDVIDYLQVDCDPPSISYAALTKIPLWKYKFKVITFEHDAYVDETNSIREKSRKYLESFGYELVVSNIAPDDHSPYEDWWVHPDFIDKTIINKIKDITDKTKHAEKFMLN